MSTPTQRSLKLLRDAGYHACVLEHWNAFARRRIDAFGFGDILAVKGSMNGSYLVQTTSRANMSARLNKILEIAAAQAWLRAGNGILIHGWAKIGNRWQCKVREVGLEDFFDAPEIGETVVLSTQ